MSNSWIDVREAMPERALASVRAWGGRVAMGALLAVAGCAGVEVENLQAREQFERETRPPGTVYTGWRVFQDRCASCHGPAATGGTGGPDLLPRVRPMGPREFVSVVLSRYDALLATGPGIDGTRRDALIDDIVQRRQGRLAMPAWQGEPRVNAHVMDLHAYLSARAAGVQGPGRPEP